MAQSRVSTVPYTVFSQHRQGYVRVALSALSFDGRKARNPDVKNIRRLEQVFDLVGCDRSDPINFVPALVEPEVLQHFRNSTASTLQSAEDPPLVDLPSDARLHCLHGYHRIEAARRHLQGPERWWTVTLYDTGLPENARTALIEQNSNELQFSDGDIFCYIRRWTDPHLQRKWLARLTPCKRRNLAQLRKACEGKLVHAFDELIPFGGLWQGFHLGSLNRILPMRTYEEYLHYLVKIKALWKFLVQDHPSDIVTPATVNALELLVPDLSRSDREKARHRITTDLNIFPGVSGAAREEIIGRVFQCHRILTLHTFFEDTIYLEVCHQALRLILPNRKAYIDGFETAFRLIYRGSDFEADYIRLWLCAMREFRELTDIAASRPRKDKGRPKAAIHGINDDRVFSFRKYAESRGFSCLQLEEVAEADSFSPASLAAPLYATDLLDVPMKARCNRPLEKSQRTDQKFLHFEHIRHQPSGEDLEFITTFTIARDIVASFWNLDGISADISMPRPPSPSPGPPPAVPTSQSHGVSVAAGSGHVPDSHVAESERQPAAVPEESAPRDWQAARTSSLYSFSTAPNAPKPPSPMIAESERQAVASTPPSAPLSFGPPNAGPASKRRVLPDLDTPAAKKSSASKSGSLTDEQRADFEDARKTLSTSPPNSFVLVVSETLEPSGRKILSFRMTDYPNLESKIQGYPRDVIHLSVAFSANRDKIQWRTTRIEDLFRTLTQPESTRIARLERKRIGNTFMPGSGLKVVFDQDSEEKTLIIEPSGDAFHKIIRCGRSEARISPLKRLQLALSYESGSGRLRVEASLSPQEPNTSDPSSLLPYTLNFTCEARDFNNWIRPWEEDFVTYLDRAVAEAILHDVRFPAANTTAAHLTTAELDELNIQAPRLLEGPGGDDQDEVL